jgi:predicted nucleotidyltransferase
MQDEVRQLLLRAAHALGELADEMVFVGGATTGLLVSDRGAPEVRITRDVDVIIEVSSLKDYYDFAERLRHRGFSEGRDLVCRWTHGDQIVLDVMPTDERILGFSNRFYREAIASANRYALEPDLSIRVIAPAYFCATKLIAFEGRGGCDYAASHDLEDFLSVVDGRPELVDEIEAADDAVRAFLKERVRALLDTSAFIDLLGGFLPADAASQARLPLLLDRLNGIAST